MLLLRALLFYTGITAALIVCTPLSWLARPLPFSRRYPVATLWTRFSLWWLRITCRIRYEVQGQEHVPDGPIIVLCKHQSAWETMAVQLIFDQPLTFIMKRELLWIPFFGWGLAVLEPIAIDRRRGVRAFRQIVDQGQERLARGISVIVYPEGTRVAAGESSQYQPGGGMLAEKTGYPVIPMAHNAGLFWPRSSILKYPGTIQVRLGPPIETRGKRAKQITATARAWIEPNSQALLP